MKTSKKMKEQIKFFEGLSLNSYNDVGGIGTIGWGHTGKNLPNEITLVQAEHFFESDIAEAEKKVNEYMGVYSFTQNEYDALVSFAFNIGNIDQLTDNGTRSRKTIAEKILLYCHAFVNGKQVKLEGLVKRRQYEHDLFVHEPGVLVLRNGYNMRVKPGTQYGIVCNTNDIMYNECEYDIKECNSDWRKVVLTLYVHKEGFTS